MKIYNTQRPISEIPTSRLTKENAKYIQDLQTLLLDKRGSGLVNNMLKNLPIPEMHLSLPSNVPSEYVQNGSFNNTGKYSFCGPGTKTQQRLKEGYKGVNSLDAACKLHDIYYSKYSKTKDRNKADDILAHEASKIALDETAPDYVRNDARKITSVMSAKSKFGMGSKNV